MEEYEESLLIGGHVPGARSIPDFIKYTGQQLFKVKDPKDLAEGEEVRTVPGHLKVGNILLLAYAHLTTALERRYRDPQTSSLPSITSAVEIGLRNARQWELSADQEDIGLFLIDLSNNYLKGAVTSFLASIKFTAQVLVPSFERWQEAEGFSTSTLPPSGPNSYYDIMWKYAKDRYPTKYGKITFTDFMDLRAVTGRLTKWKIVSKFERHCGQYASFTSPDLNHAVVLRALLLLTQHFDSEFRHSLPQLAFEAAFLGWSRHCYVNSKSLHGEPVWFVRTSEDLIKFGLLLRCDMKFSVLYKGKASAKPKSDETPPTKQRKRGNKAEQEAVKIKQACVEAKETLTLAIGLANGKSRNRFFVEEVAVANNAAFPSLEKEQEELLAVIYSRADHHTLNANFAMMDTTRFYSFEGNNLKKYTEARKAFKKWLADANQAKSLPEQADAAAAHASILEDLGEEKAEWQVVVSNPATAMKFPQYLEMMRGKEITETKMFQDGCEVFQQAGQASILASNLDKVLVKVHEVMEAHCDKDMRIVALKMPGEIQKIGKLPEDVQGLLMDLRDVKLVGFGRAKVMLEAAKNFGLTKGELVRELLTPKVQDVVGNLDIFVDNPDLWQRIWTFLLAPAPTTVAQRLDSIKMILRPPALALGESDETDETDASANNAAVTHKRPALNVVSLLAHFDKSSMQIPVLGKDGKPTFKGKKMVLETVPFRVLNRFMRELEHHIYGAVLDNANADVGYSYLAFISATGQSARKLCFADTTLSAVKLNFFGSVTFTPRFGAMLLCKHWGIQFYMQPDPSQDIENDFYPAWQVPVCKSDDKADKDNADKDKKDTPKATSSKETITRICK